MNGKSSEVRAGFVGQAAFLECCSQPLAPYQGYTPWKSRALCPTAQINRVSCIKGIYNGALEIVCTPLGRESVAVRRGQWVALQARSNEIRGELAAIYVAAMPKSERSTLFKFGGPDKSWWHVRSQPPSQEKKIRTSSIRLPLLIFRSFITLFHTLP
jgi:hypothetical protein